MRQGKMVDIVHDDAAYPLQERRLRPLGQMLPEPKEQRQFLVTPIDQPGLGKVALVGVKYFEESLHRLTGCGGDCGVQQVNGSSKIFDG
jgi:hypothetical protein